MNGSDKAMAIRVQGSEIGNFGIHLTMCIKIEKYTDIENKKELYT